jgi:hypothetical protein
VAQTRFLAIEVNRLLTLAEHSVDIYRQRLNLVATRRAPVALQPDALLAPVLMAPTFPDQVHATAEWSKTNARQNVDESVKAGAHAVPNDSVAGEDDRREYCVAGEARSFWCRSQHNRDD